MFPEMSSAALTIAVGIDHSPESRAAARWAAAATGSDDRQLLLVHGYAPPLMVQSLPGYRPDVAHESAVSLVDEVATELTRDFGVQHISTVVSHEAPIPLLTHVSDTADVLILGHHQLRWSERFAGGSISSALSGLSHCPVVTVPFGRPHSDGPVGLALDIDAPSEQALEVAFDRAMLTPRPHVWVVCAIPDALDADEISRRYERARELVKPWEARYPTCRVTIQLVPGQPHRTLAEVVPHPSLQVVTRPASTRWINSVARAMQRRSDWPIAVIDHR